MTGSTLTIFCVALFAMFGAAATVHELREREWLDAAKAAAATLAILVVGGLLTAAIFNVEQGAARDECRADVRERNVEREADGKRPISDAYCDEVQP